MSHSQILQGSAGTRRLLTNLDLAIDEAKLVRRIVDLGDQLQKAGSHSEEKKKARYLQQEIDHCEDKLVVLRSMMDSVAISFGFS